MEHVLLVRYSEIHLKGLNRPFFEKKLVQNMYAALHGMKCRIERTQGRIFVWGISEQEQDVAINKLQRVFGIHSLSPAVAVVSEWEDICQAAVKLMQKELAINTEKTSFKVAARRADKMFFKRSDQINRDLGEFMLNAFPQLHVDVHHPEILVGVEVRERTFVYVSEYLAVDGMPTGTSGRAALLISGGIDSPVAGYMIAKRGVELSAVHFYSYPYTSERARDKVVELTRLLSQYSGEIRLHLVPFTDIQLAIYDHCPPSQTTILMRRLMMKITEMIAQEDGAQALITGEAIGQVASQTIESLVVTNDAVSMPVFRPLIGFDKEEIIIKAKEIGTFETSILPYEDCCTVFVPQHPMTKPKLSVLRESEGLVDFTDMIAQALKDKELLCITPDFAQADEL